MDNIIILIIMFAVGLVLIVKGADWLTEGASSIARRFRISSLVIGLTIVALGTSMPEMVVSLFSAIEGKTSMAIGNVVGSNIFNALAIMGVTAMICPVVCTKQNLHVDIPLSVWVSVLLLLLCLLGGGLAWYDGVILLVGCVAFVLYSIYLAKLGRKNETDEEKEAKKEEMPPWKAIVMFIVGLAGLVVGGNWMVDGASGIASHLGVSDAIIAVTIVAAGTSFPELMTSVVSARKGDTDMAMGNVVGSNIINILLILGTSSVIAPLPLGDINVYDLVIVLGSSMLLLLFCVWNSRNRESEKDSLVGSEGFFLLLCAVGYYVWKAMA